MENNIIEDEAYYERLYNEYKDKGFFLNALVRDEEAFKLFLDRRGIFYQVNDYVTGNETLGILRKINFISPVPQIMPQVTSMNIPLQQKDITIVSKVGAGLFYVINKDVHLTVEINKFGAVALIMGALKNGIKYNSHEIVIEDDLAVDEFWEMMGKAYDRYRATFGNKFREKILEREYISEERAYDQDKEEYTNDILVYKCYHPITVNGRELKLWEKYLEETDFIHGISLKPSNDKNIGDYEIFIHKEFVEIIKGGKDNLEVKDGE